MTSRWDELGLWDQCKADYKERFATKPHMVRPSTLPLEQSADVYVGQRAKAYLKEYSRSEPWFCWISFGGPHEPWDTPEPYASMYNPADMPKPVPKPGSSQRRVQGVLDDRFENAPDLNAEDISSMRADYAGNVSLIDDQIGEILHTIEARGELDSTVIAFSSDHGEMNGDQGLIYKSNFLNGAVRVPLLIRTPETMRRPVTGAVSDCPVEWFDIGPTLVELAGGALEHQQFARSLCPALVECPGDQREFAISEIHGEVMYLDRKWKLALNANGLPYLIFDLENDPGEQCNLVGDASVTKTVVELRLRIQEHLLRTQVQLHAKKG